jgi:GTP-binding protein HflX
LLFATLDTTMRALELPSGKKAILSDTVGFISDLPTQLVAAFRATLEEVQEAAVILHVRDMAQSDTEAERADVLAILRDLGIDSERDERIVEVLNKTDSLPARDRATIEGRAKRQDNLAAVSALTGAGLDRLLGLIDARLGKDRVTVSVDIDITDGKAMAWLYRRGKVMTRKDTETSARLKVSLDPEDCDRFTAQFAYKMKKLKK